MTNKEAIKILNAAKLMTEGISDLSEACKMAISALEKQIPKKPIYQADGYYDGELVYDTWLCPNCDTAYDVDMDEHNYCPNCGQAIDWLEEGEQNGNE